MLMLRLSSNEELPGSSLDTFTNVCVFVLLVVLIVVSIVLSKVVLIVPGTTVEKRWSDCANECNRSRVSGEISSSSC